MTDGALACRARALAKRALVAVAVCSGAGLVAAPEQSGGLLRVLYVSVTDERGQRVEGLRPEDLSVREAGRERAVESVTPVSERLRVAVAIDELMTGSGAIREATLRLVRRLHERGDVALYLVGRRTERRVAYGADMSAYVAAINAFPTSPQYAGTLVEGLFEIAREQRPLEGRRVIVAIAPEIPERSARRAEGVFDELRDGRITFSTATFVGWKTQSAPLKELPPTRLEGGDFTQDIERDRVLGDGPGRSGGLRVASTTAEAVGTALERIADDLLNQVQVTYWLPAGTKSDGRVSLTVKRKDLKVRGSIRLPEVK